jgi:hypothetical protein
MGMSPLKKAACPEKAGSLVINVYQAVRAFTRNDPSLM